MKMSRKKKSKKRADDPPNEETTTIKFQDYQDDSYRVDDNVDGGINDGDNNDVDDDEDDVLNQSNFNKKKVRETSMVVEFIKRELENVYSLRSLLRAVQNECTRE